MTVRTRTVVVDRETTIEGSDSAVTLEKLFTPKGERLRIAPAGIEDSLRLDAVNLESLTWQEPEIFERLASRSGPDPEPRTVPPEAVGSTADATPFATVSNEFAEADLSTVDRGPETALLVEATKLDYGVRLDAATLVVLAGQDWETLSGFMEAPLGLE